MPQFLGAFLGGVKRGGPIKIGKTKKIWEYHGDIINILLILDNFIYLVLMGTYGNCSWNSY